MRILALLAVIASFLALAIVAGTGALSSVTSLTDLSSSPTDVDPGRHESNGSSAGDVLLPIALMILAIGGILFVAGLIAIGTLVAVRARHRRDREVVRYELVPFRADEVGPEQVRRLLESWHQQLLERWRRRPIVGQPAISLEVVMEPDMQGRLQGRFLIAMPPHLVGAVEGSLRACYPNCRLGPRREPPGDPRAMVRLKKRQRFIQALHSPSDEDPVITDALLTEMAALGSPSVVQLTLTPTPALFDLYARHVFRRRERAAVRRRGWDKADPGLGSELLSRELEGGLKVQYNPLFFVEIRIGAETPQTCRSIAGVLRGGTGGENRLVQRPLYARPGRLDLYRERLRRAWGNPLPSWRHGVYSSTELTAMWRLPSPGLTSVPVVRSSVPRIQASPEISRQVGHAILRDEHGSVGIRPEDKTDGLGLIGGQKTGKTSVLCQTVRVDADDPDCALIVLMPKPGDAVKALSMVPAWRTVHYLDFEAPEFGINPLLADGEPAMIADKVVDSFRDVNMEGDIRGSSDRFLRQAAQAAIGASRAGALEGPPNLWHMYRLLLPSEEAFRDHVVRSIYTDPRFVDTATYFGRDLPNDLQDARSNTASKLDAPRNKILRLMVESLDKVLRHPRQLDLDAVIRNREVLVVDGKMGTFGSDNCRVMMQFILNMLYGSLQRQQQLPEHERVRVAVKVDEAHLILNESFADALATLRSAGLEVVAAWQYGEQIQDPKIRGGMMSLLRQRCMFSMGEGTDAREMSEVAMSVYTDVIRADPESRARLRFTPDTIFNLPNFHALCTWISQGARTPAFVAQTIPLREDAAVISQHLGAQRARGGFVPDRLPDPLPDVQADELRELPLAGDRGVAEEGGDREAAVPSIVTSNGQREPDPVPTSGPPRGGNGGGVTDRDRVAPAVAEGPDLPFDPASTTIEAPNARPGESGNGARAVPDSYTELDLDDVRGIDWDEVDVLPLDRRHEPSQRELEIMAALWQYRVLFATQMWRKWWGGATLRAAQHALNKMARAGWVRRCRFATSQRGSQQRMYILTHGGFDIARERLGRNGPFIDPGIEWREAQITDPRRLLRDLRVNGWIMAFEKLAPHAVVDWRGPRRARLLPPRRRVRGEFIDLRPQDVTVGGSRQIEGIELPRFEPVAPDAAVEIRLAVPGAPLRFDLLLEMERGRGGASRESKLRRYDALITGWARLLDRYQMLKTPPVVVFVAQDEPSALGIVKLADRVLTGRLAKVGEDEMEWPHPARRGIFVVCERDMHMGSLAAYQLPERPPEMRVRLGGRQARACHPRRVELVEPRLLRMK